MKKRYVYCSLIFILTLSCQSKNGMETLMDEVETIFAKGKGTFAVAFKDLETGQTLFVNEHGEFHAASTMKTPVMMEVFRQAEQHKFSLLDSIEVKNSFRSIVDGSIYALNASDDSEQSLYGMIGEKISIGKLVEEMIVRSSNLATNMVIELVGAESVTKTIRDLGANNIQVLRGVEDQKAYDNGLNNTTTAYDLMLIFEAIAKYKAVSAEASEKMINILSGQQFNEMIPAHLPSVVKVAHKTGNITGVRHDGGIVFLPDGRKYILVLLSKDLEDEKDGIKTMAQISKVIYEHVTAL